MTKPLFKKGDKVRKLVGSLIYTVTKVTKNKVTFQYRDNTTEHEIDEKNLRAV